MRIGSECVVEYKILGTRELTPEPRNFDQYFFLRAVDTTAIYDMYNSNATI